MNPAGVVPLADQGTWIERHPIAAYFLWAFAGTWLFLLPGVLGQNGLGLLPFTLSMPVFVILFILGDFAGPTLAAIVITKKTEGPSGLRAFFRRYAQWRVGVGWLLVAVLGYPLLYLVTASIWLGAAPWRALAAQWQLIFTLYLPGLLIFPALITWGEEPGWRGFALPRLQAAYGPVVGTVILGTLHSVWHLPAMLIPAFWGGPFTLTGLAINTFSIVVLSLIWTWIFNNAKGSILIAVLVHASGNATGSLMQKLVPSPPLEGRAYPYAFAAVCLLVLVFTRGRLSYQRLRSTT